MSNAGGEVKEKALSDRHISVALFVACGVLAFLVLFIFAKRQIMRFTLRSKKAPYISIGHTASHSLRQEIQRRLSRISQMQCDPTLMTEYHENAFDESAIGYPSHLYRMKALDRYKVLDEEMKDCRVTTCRKPREKIGSYLFCFKDNIFKSMRKESLEQFVRLYEHARHKPKKFGHSEFSLYSDLWLQLIKCIKSYKCQQGHTSRVPKITVTTIPGGNNSNTPHHHHGQQLETETVPATQEPLLNKTPMTVTFKPQSGKEEDQGRTNSGTRM